MPKVTAIIGSPRKNGKTFKNVKKFEEQLMQLDEDINFSIILINAGTCSE